MFIFDKVKKGFIDISKFKLDNFAISGSIFDIIAKIGSYIQNTKFIDAFLDKFVTDYIDSNKHFLKMITYYNNPLNRLMDIHRRQRQISNHLLLRLIERSSKEIRPDDDELFHHSFTDPARDTCTYVILFDDCIAKLPIRDETLNRLQEIWLTWENQQLTYEQIWRKKHYSPDQEYCFNKIWEIVGKHIGKQYQIAVLFDAAHKDMMEKTKIKEKITTCLNDYCNQATDKQTYMDLLSALQDQIEQSWIKEIRISPELKQLIPFVEQLIPFSSVHAWQQYYTKQLQKQGKYSISPVFLRASIHAGKATETRDPRGS